jgi:hypothetical protein
MNIWYCIDEDCSEYSMKTWYCIDEDCSEYSMKTSYCIDEDCSEYSMKTSYCIDEDSRKGGIVLVNIIKWDIISINIITIISGSIL